MLDILQTVLEWLLPQFLPSPHHPAPKTNIMAVRQENVNSSPPPIFSSPDPISTDSVANILPYGFAGAHVMLVAFTVLVICVIISNLTIRIVERARIPGKEIQPSDTRTPRSPMLPNGLPPRPSFLIKPDVQRHRQPQDQRPSDYVKWKWILQKHEADLVELKKLQIEHDLKLSYLSRRISRREKNFPNHAPIKKRAEFTLDSNRALTSSEDEAAAIELNRDDQRQCRCLYQKGTQESFVEKVGGDQIGVTKQSETKSHRSSYGQGDALPDERFKLGTKLANFAKLDSRQTQPRLLDRPRGSHDVSPRCRDEFQNFFEKRAPTPPPRPDLPPRNKILKNESSKRGDSEVGLLTRFTKRHQAEAKLQNVPSDGARKELPPSPTPESAPVPVPVRETAAGPTAGASAPLLALGFPLTTSQSVKRPEDTNKLEGDCLEA